MATKKELIKQLLELGVPESEATEDKTNKVLEEMLAEAKAEAEKSIENEGSQEDPKGVGDEESSSENGNEISEDEEKIDNALEEKFSMTTQLDIFREFLYVQKYKDSTIVVENLGFGDIYVGDGHQVVYGNRKQLLKRGQSKEITDQTTVQLVSASMPEVKIAELK